MASRGEPMQLPQAEFRRTPWTTLACMAVLVLGSAGCSKADRPPVYAVKGRVLLRGKPTTNALVTFHPVADAGADAIRPVGHVDNEGNFTLTTYAAGDGAPEGRYQVTVVWYLAAPVRGPKGGDET